MQQAREGRLSPPEVHAVALAANREYFSLAVRDADVEGRDMIDKRGTTPGRDRCSSGRPGLQRGRATRARNVRS